MSRVFVLLTIVFSILNLGAGLKCYTCLASTTSNCYDGVESSYVHQECVQQSYKNFSLLPSVPQPAKTSLPANTNEPIKNVCVRLAYSDISETFIRGCGYIYESIDICEYLEELINVKECSYCEEDFCNI